jgi:hypothetical protein
MFEAKRVEHRQFPLLKKDLPYLSVSEEIQAFNRFLQDRRSNYHPTESFKALLMVFAPAPEVPMTVMLTIMDETFLYEGDIYFNFLHHTRGCDWEKAIIEYGQKLKEGLQKRMENK